MIRDLMIAMAVTQERRVIEVGDVEGGETIQVGNVRYHIFRTPGDATVEVKADGPIEYAVIGGGEDGKAGTAGAAGAGGKGGHVIGWTSMLATQGTTLNVHVGGPGQASTFDGHTAAGAAGDGTTLTGLPSELGLGTTLGGNGASDVAPATPALGQGGSGGFNVQASYPEPSHNETHQNPSRQETVDRSYGATATQVQTGTQRVVGDACVGGACPGGWNCEGRQVGQSGMMMHEISPGNCVTNVPTYGTQYSCPSGGSLSGTTCVKHETITVGGGSSTVQVWDGCKTGFNSVNHVCVDAKGTAAGKGGGGAVLIRHTVVL